MESLEPQGVSLDEALLSFASLEQAAAINDWHNLSNEGRLYLLELLKSGWPGHQRIPVARWYKEAGGLCEDAHTTHSIFLAMLQALRELSSSLTNSLRSGRLVAHLLMRSGEKIVISQSQWQNLKFVVRERPPAGVIIASDGAIPAPGWARFVDGLLFNALEAASEDRAVEHVAPGETRETKSGGRGARYERLDAACIKDAIAQLNSDPAAGSPNRVAAKFAARLWDDHREEAGSSETAIRDRLGRKIRDAWSPQTSPIPKQH